MTRATLKVPKGTADRLARAKLEISVALDSQVTTGLAIEYLLAHWLITRGQHHRLALGPDGAFHGATDAPAEPA